MRIVKLEKIDDWTPIRGQWVAVGYLFYYVIDVLKIEDTIFAVNLSQDRHPNITFPKLVRAMDAEKITNMSSYIWGGTFLIEDITFQQLFKILQQHIATEIHAHPDTNVV